MAEGARARSAVRWAAIAVIVLSLAAIARALPAATLLARLEGAVQGLGPAGPFLFAAAYAVLALLFVPGSVMTLAAGALFGVALGTAVVSAASTAAAALAFLIARHLARAPVGRLARRHPRFGALDRAVKDGGWKVVALLRLSPVVPFSAGNYLFGLLDLRFGPYVLASWLAMLPATLVYVALGHAAREGIEALGEGRRGRTPGEWALLGVGIAATVAVTVLLSRRARVALQNRASEEDSMRKTGEAGGAGSVRPGRGGTWALAGAALLLAAAAAGAWACRGALEGLFGPPPVTMSERYEERPDGPAFDHSLFGQVLARHVGEDGLVSYRELKGDPDALERYVQGLAAAPFDALGRNEKLALLIDAYNAFTLKLIVEHYPIGSIKDIPDARRWDDRRWRVGPHTWSLNEIEHGQIRPAFVEPRIHFALVCAAKGCPPLRREAYVGSRVAEQLEEQTRFVLGDARWYRFDEPALAVSLTRLFDWYAGDFEQAAGGVLEWVARYDGRLAAALAAGRKPSIAWLEYDWALNDRDGPR